MLSNRITANSLDENPDIHANNNIANVINELHPAVFRLINDLVDLFIFVY